MSETNSATGGFRRITRLQPPVQMRLLGFGVVIVCGSLLVGWITRSTWQQLDQLQKEYAAVRSEGFYLGVSMRGAIRSLNDRLLQHSLTRDPQIRTEFLRESEELSRRIDTNRAHLVEMANLQLMQGAEVSQQLELLSKASASYTNYLTNATAMLAAKQIPRTSGYFEKTYQRVRESSSEFVAYCDQLVQVQRQGFTEFIFGTQLTLGRHQRLLKLTSALILTMAASLALLVYRGMITPLRLGLSRSQSIIERQEKLASLGILASGVAHEIRNPLTAIKFRLFSLKKAVPAVASNEDADIIAGEINRLERIVKDFLQFARPSEPALARIPADRIVREVFDLMKPQLERTAIQLRNVTKDTGWVYADAQQIKQVLINLVQNAAENIGRNGSVTLQVRRENVEIERRHRPAVILAVIDTGHGIPPEVELRLFDPFFTTKQGGTGLGLSVAARIVDKHGGLLRYETEVNQGTTFEVVLPEVEHDKNSPN